MNVSLYDGPQPLESYLYVQMLNWKINVNKHTMTIHLVKPTKSPTGKMLKQFIVNTGNKEKEIAQLMTDHARSIKDERMAKKQGRGYGSSPRTSSVGGNDTSPRAADIAEGADEDEGGEKEEVAYGAE